MPAKSKKQQRFFGMVRAAQKGKLKAKGDIARAAESMKPEDVKDFAATKHENLPEKKATAFGRLVANYKQPK